MVPTSKEIYRLVTGHIKHFLPFSHILVLQKGQWQTCMFITVMRVWTAQFMCQAIVGCCLELTDTLGCWLILTKNAICHHIFSKPKYLETANTTPITERLICAQQRMRFKKKIHTLSIMMMKDLRSPAHQQLWWQGYPSTLNICLNIIFSCEHDLSVMILITSKLEGGRVHLFFTPKAWGNTNTFVKTERKQSFTRSLGQVFGCNEVARLQY